MQKLILTLSLCAFLCTGSIMAQIQTPAPSPACMVKQTVGLTDIAVEYSRPSVKGRTIFAEDGLVPYGKPWRTGANAATKISFSTDVEIGGQQVEAGEYAMLTEPNAAQWKVMLFPYESSNWGSYLDMDPAATFTAKPKETPHKMESFTIMFADLGMNNANLHMAWDRTMVSIPVRVDVDKLVEASIERVMAGPNSGDYYRAASYYHDAGKDLNQALTWIETANEMDPRFWQLRRESLILADLGRYEDAIAAAKKSKAMAEEAGNEDYVAMNTKSIAEWMAKTTKPAKSKSMKAKPSKQTPGNNN